MYVCMYVCIYVCVCECREASCAWVDHGLGWTQELLRTLEERRAQHPIMHQVGDIIMHVVWGRLRPVFPTGVCLCLFLWA
jgi:hypothetical protein